MENKPEDERLEALLKLEVDLHATLHQYFVDNRKINGSSTVYDEAGPSSFVVVAFNHIVSEEILPADADEQDKCVAVACVTNMISPDVVAGPNSTIGPDQTLPVGIHAASAAILLSAVQNGAVTEAMKRAQSEVITYKRKLSEAH